LTAIAIAAGAEPLQEPLGIDLAIPLSLTWVDGTPL
jgi:hypothetical protein